MVKVKGADVFASLRANDPEAALAAVTQLLREDQDCPYFLVQRAMLIQIVDDAGELTLADAERDLERAHKLDGAFLSAIEELAHFYDAVDPNPDKARHFAKLFLQKVEQSLTQMKEIAESQ